MAVFVRTLDKVAIIAIGRKFAAMLVGPFLWSVDIVETSQATGRVGMFQSKMTSLRM